MSLSTGSPLLIGRRAVAGADAHVFEAVDDPKPGDLLPDLVAQGRMGPDHIGKLRIASRGRQFDGMKHRQQCGHRRVGLVAVPEVIRLEIRIFRGPARRVEVGNLMNGFQRRPVGFAEHVAFDFAKHRRDFSHAILAELLAAEDQQMVNSEGCQNLFPQRFRYRLAEIDAADFGTEAGVERCGYSCRTHLRHRDSKASDGMVSSLALGFMRSEAPFQARSRGSVGDIVDKYTL